MCRDRHTSRSRGHKGGGGRGGQADIDASYSNSRGIHW